MSVLDTFKAFLKDIKQLDSYGFSTDNSLIDPDGIRTDKLPVFPEWFWSAKLGQPRQINVYEVRQFAKSPWVQMVLNTIKKEVMIIDWDLVNVDEEDEDNHESDKKKVMDFFNKINSDGQNILDLCNPVITDLGEIDAGVWAKVFDVNSYEKKVLPVIDDMGKVVGEEEKFVLKPFGQRTIKEVRVGDASSFLKQIDIWGRLKAYFQYSFKNPRTNPNKFEPDEIIYFQMNKRSYSLYGFSPVQAIQQVLEVLIQSTRWNKEFFKSNAVPDGIIGMEGANPDSMRKFKEDWEKNIKGKAHKLAFMNTKVDFANLSPSSRDMEWLEGQKWYFHLVFGVFGVSPVEAGFHENVNQGNQAGQERVTVKNAIKPYLKALQNPINSFLIPEILQQENPKIKFKFLPIDHVEEKVNFDNSMKEIEVGTQTINEYRKYRGRAEVEWGDVPPNKSVPNTFLDDEQTVDSSNNPSISTDEEEELGAKTYKRVVAIGPRGGRITGYDSRGRPIYGDLNDSRPKAPSIDEQIKNYSSYHDKQIDSLKKSFPDRKVYGRMKEKDSIIGKLKRKPDLYKKVSDLRDISGIRVESDSVKKVYADVEKLKKTKNVVNIKDYVANPQNGVYRSVHVIIQDGDKFSEVQVRTSNMTKLADYTHDRVYKAPVDKLDVIKKFQSHIDKYLADLSSYFDKLDNGLRGVIPACLEVIKKSIGCYDD